MYMTTYFDVHYNLFDVHYNLFDVHDNLFDVHCNILDVHYYLFDIYEGVSINTQPIPFPMDRDGHDFHALFQYMFYTWVQNCTRIESFFNKILNVKHG